MYALRKADLVPAASKPRSHDDHHDAQTADDDGRDTEQVVLTDDDVKVMTQSRFTARWLY